MTTRAFSPLLLALTLLASPVAAQTDDVVVEPEAGPVRVGVAELRDHYQAGRLRHAIQNMLLGTVGTGLGTYVLIDGLTGEGQASTSLRLLGLAVLTPAATRLASGFYDIFAPTAPEKTADRILEMEENTRAGLIFLEHEARRARRERISGAIGDIASGASNLALALIYRRSDEEVPGTTIGPITITIGVVGAVELALGIYDLAFSTSSAEEIWGRVSHSYVELRDP